jgi:pyruvate carboxylase
LAERAGVPVVPGSSLADSETAGQIGYPLIVKAAFGGGGRGMRVVERVEDFAGKVEEARKEAGAAFGNDAVFLEKYIRRARHIEVQILGDQHGSLMHLFERDCSVQRRHQKVVEVAPALAISSVLRERLCDAALAIGKAAGYYNAWNTPLRKW